MLKGAEVHVFERGPLTPEDWTQDKQPVKYKVHKMILVQIKGEHRT